MVKPIFVYSSVILVIFDKLEYLQFFLINLL